ncbi:SH3 domain-containing protein [Leptothermofonsia sichuanensis E412]|uniref:SH3 domain-containing protein n=1 Tax=Leptothermofonsia sichuanensis TaxID=2917832 RepID=UPI001CA784B4|nr:SH3 domain-containing protein [Leptothermofonsia sichuanensis]QZZ20547.1 SH3 domain-containing protein [Leptothermofonsia sichuanensis E412]
MRWSDLIKVLSGVFLAVVLIASGSFIAAQHVISQFTALPPKPTFPNDKPAPDDAKPAPGNQPASTADPVKVAGSPAPAKPSPIPSPFPSPSPNAQPSPPKTEASGYRAKIVLSQGLNLRGDPNRDAERVGGVDYNEQVIILEDSPDGEWQKVRIESSGQEGWIKSGYAERLN